ncbi:MAG TPA: bifunctional nuclease domain-containing protein [Methylomirabilota bacterium]|nr:bifunctional nuclease domain-containing protein [Methylomirabilota bacterium]
MNSHDLTPMRVLDLSTCRITGQPALLLEDAAGTQRLAFYLPLNEANRLSRALGMGECSCTPIFELTESVIAALPARVLRAELEGDEHGISGALVLVQHGLELRLPSHPADALALAIRARAPILATASALARACRAEGAARRTEVRQWVDRVRPDDFGPPSEG